MILPRGHNKRAVSISLFKIDPVIVRHFPFHHHVVMEAVAEPSALELKTNNPQAVVSITERLSPVPVFTFFLQPLAW